MSRRHDSLAYSEFAKCDNCCETACLGRGSGEIKINLIAAR
jgi:hypothetical protein